MQIPICLLLSKSLKIVYASAYSIILCSSLPSTRVLLVMLKVFAILLKVSWSSFTSWQDALYDNSSYFSFVSEAKIDSNVSKKMMIYFVIFFAEFLNKKRNSTRQTRLMNTIYNNSSLKLSVTNFSFVWLIVYKN